MRRLHAVRFCSPRPPLPPSLPRAQVKEAMHAVTQLHGQRVTPGGGGKKAKAAQGGGEGGASPALTLWCREVKGEGALVKQWRVIIRNLPFKVRAGRGGRGGGGTACHSTQC